MELSEIKELLELKHEQYNNASFVEKDPICIPHRFTMKEDIEIAAFLTATISWGQRATIIKNSAKIMDLMDQAPFEFITNHNDSDLARFNSFVHRTFKNEDLVFFIRSLKNIYTNRGGLENIFSIKPSKTATLYDGITHFRTTFFEIDHPTRTLKHISNLQRNSSGKRLMMFLRWMVRCDRRGVDFGIWKKITPAELFLPLDVHTANASRKLGLLTLRSEGWKSVLEITEKLRQMDATDPIKYDFALFGLSAFGEI